jgi:coproporphyrinogen III oxidase-like Fe-S oxidoreductase
MRSMEPQVQSLTADDFLHKTRDSVSLTPKGRLLSNEVFQRLLLSGVPS